MARLIPADETLLALPIKMRLVPTMSVLFASSLVILPLDISAPMLPPFGFLLLISWRLLRGDIWPVWIGIPLGLVDDIFSGQPIGSAVALWTCAMLAIEAIDRRIVWRDFWIDWLLATMALFIYLLAGALLARSGDIVHVVALILPQFLWSAMLLPLAMRVAATLDGWRRLP